MNSLHIFEMVPDLPPLGRKHIQRGYGERKQHLGVVLPSRERGLRDPRDL